MIIALRAGTPEDTTVQRCHARSSEDLKVAIICFGSLADIVMSPRRHFCFASESRRALELFWLRTPTALDRMRMRPTPRSADRGPVSGSRLRKTGISQINARGYPLFRS